MTSFRIALTVALALVVPTHAFTQATPPTPRSEPSLRSFVPDLVDDARRLPSNAAAVSVAIGGILAAGLSPFDDEVAEWEPSDNFESGTWIGNSLVLAAGTLAAYTVGEWADMPRAKVVAVDMLRAQTLALGVTYAMKYTIGRERPDESSNDSFPSGHAAQTFATAAVLARYFGMWAAVPAFGVASFVVASRLNQRRHYVSDVAFGAGLGVAVGWNGARGKSSWNVTPTVSRSELGVRVSHALGS